jgi:hypothetical protein
MVPRVSVVMRYHARAACSQAARACAAASAHPSSRVARSAEPCWLARAARVWSRSSQWWLMTDDQLLITQHAYGIPVEREPVLYLRSAAAGDMAPPKSMPSSAPGHVRGQ